MEPAVVLTDAEKSAIAMVRMYGFHLKVLPWTLDHVLTGAPHSNGEWHSRLYTMLDARSSGLFRAVHTTDESTAALAEFVQIAADKFNGVGGALGKFSGFSGTLSMGVVRK